MCAIIDNEQTDSLVAIDDIAFKACEYGRVEDNHVCKSDGEFQCMSGRCVANSTLCDLNDDCCDGSDELFHECSLYHRCSFENDLCLFEHVNQSDLAFWQRTRPSSLGENTLLDHTHKSSQVN